MKLTVLTDNTAGGSFLAEHGLSYLIEINGEKVLFDTGHSDVFLQNAAQKGLDLHTEVKTIVLSHGHWDHGDGLAHLRGQRLICHPLVFMPRFRRLNGTYLGLALSEQEAKERFDVHTTKQALEVLPNLIFLGEVPRLNDFEAQSTTFIDANKQADFVPDDSALVAIDGDEIVVITACSHAGICNIVDYAMKVSGKRQIRAIIGGFHLKQKDAQTQKVIACLQALGVKEIYPSHCTELPALSAFYDAFGIHQVKTGMVFEWL